MLEPKIGYCYLIEKINSYANFSRIVEVRNLTQLPHTSSINSTLIIKLIKSNIDSDFMYATKEGFIGLESFQWFYKAGYIIKELGSNPELIETLYG